MLYTQEKKEQKTMEKIPISRTLDGPWSAILTGAYKKKKTQIRPKCSICLSSFTNAGNLANHMRIKHKTNFVATQFLRFPKLEEEKLALLYLSKIKQNLQV